MFPIDFFRRSARLHGERTAVEEEGQVLTYRELQRRAEAVAAGLQRLAGKQRLTVALLCPNSVDLLTSILAIHACAAILVPLNPRNAPAELRSQLELVRPDVLIADASCLDLLSPGSAKLVVAGEAANGAQLTLRKLIAEFDGAQPAWPEVSPDDDYAIKFTGGSSGRPKGVRQSFRSHVAVILHILTGLHFGDEEAYLCAAPMTHGAGSFVLPTFATGGRVVIAHGTRAGDLLDTMQAHGVTATWVPPTLLYLLVEEQKRQPRALPHLRHLIFGGGPTTPEKIEEGIRAFGPVLETTYGQTEASTIATALPAREMADPAARYSAGRAGPTVRVAILDPTGRPVAAGGTGEIVVAGDLVMSGYQDMPEETAKTISGGWLHTGDVGSIDERGYLFVKDRIRDVVITGGFNVYPSDVEAALSRHPAVHECVVFGLPDAHWGERVESAVELKPGARASAEDLLEFARREIGSVKAPKRIHVLPALPRSPVGKVLRREAKAQVQAASIPLIHPR